MTSSLPLLTASIPNRLSGWQPSGLRRLLAEKANEGLITAEERSDYEALINTADLIEILKLKAQRKLTSNLYP